MRRRSLVALVGGLWWEDGRGRCARGGAVLAANALEAAYGCATLGLGCAVSLGLRCAGARSLGERALGIAPVCEVLVREARG